MVCQIIFVVNFFYVIFTISVVTYFIWIDCYWTIIIYISVSNTAFVLTLIILISFKLR